MDKITNNIINNLPKKEIKENNKSLNDLANSSPSVDKVMSSNVVDIKDTKKLVAEMAKSAPIDVDKVAKIKEAISSGKYPLDLDKLSDALMQAYREMKS
ncbi:MAG: flagellar biosynthesis anti-sigma factor FlgM [Candidatus Puniceispirillales bacterium]|tara:strand:+ start:544 stop:840 length:297 start_codon:yes stop_codon:yes gene_type:complete